MDLKSNCVQIILFYGHKGQLPEKMAETCECTQEKANEFINEYFHFLTEQEPDVKVAFQPSPEKAMDNPVT